MIPAMALSTALILPSRHDPVPICETVQVLEGSGNGPNYPIKLCGNKALPIRQIIVDGSKFPEISTTRRTITFWSG